MIRVNGHTNVPDEHDHASLEARVKELEATIEKLLAPATAPLVHDKARFQNKY